MCRQEGTKPAADLARPLSGGRILITGATGLIGVELAALLAGHDAPVGWLARNPLPPATTTATTTAREPPPVPVAVDLGDLAAVDRAVRAFSPDVVFHLAAAVGDRVPEAEAQRINVDATRALQRALPPAARLVVASTVLVLGLDDLIDAPEDLPFTGDPLIPYVATKVQMERSLSGTGAIIMRFPRVYGTRDRMILPQILELMRSGRMRLIDGGARLQSFLHVTDAARACLLAAARGTPGATYHITAGDRVTNREILDLIADAAGLPRVTRSVSLRVALAVATAAEWTTRTLGLRLPAHLSRFRVKYVGCHHHYAIHKARRELGYEPGVPLATGLPPAVRALGAGEGADRP
jgi:nucleoside-diphosphate-sugar epimerase